MNKVDLFSLTQIAHNDLLETHNLLTITQKLGWCWKYTTMNEGRFGHFVSIGFLKSKTDSNHLWIDPIEGQNFSDAATKAAQSVILQLEETNFL